MAGTMRHTDPPQRKARVRGLAPHEQADTLLRQYLCDRIERAGDKREKGVLRSFLKLINAANPGRDPGGVVLAVRRGQAYNSFEVYPQIHGQGRVETLPLVVTQGNDRLAAIHRETGPSRLNLSDPLTTPNCESEERRAMVPPKVETVMVPGRRA
jgi:hypothetical protein